MPWKHTGGAEVELHAVLTPALDWGEWLTSRFGHFNLGKEHNAWEAGWASTRLDVLEKKKFLAPTASFFFESTIPASERLKSHALDRAATVIGRDSYPGPFSP